MMIRYCLVIFLSFSFLFSSFSLPVPYGGSVAYAGLFEALFPRTTARIKKRKRRTAIVERNENLARERDFGYYTYEPRKITSVNFDNLRSPFRSHFGKLTSSSDTGVVQSASLSQSDISITVPVSRTISSSTNDFRSHLSSYGSYLSTLSLSSRSDIGSAVLSHYSKRPDFLWIGSNLRPTVAAEYVEQVLRSAYLYGLNAADYHIPALPVSATPHDILTYEFLMTFRSLRYALDARYGVSSPRKISSYHGISSQPRSISKILSSITASKHPARLLRSFHPDNSMFSALRHELLNLSFDTSGLYIGDSRIRHHTIIHPGESHKRLGMIISRISELAPSDIRARYSWILSREYEGRHTYNNDFVPLVVDMQRYLGLRPLGIIDYATLQHLFSLSSAVFLRGVDAHRRDMLIYSMERLRWLPDNLGDRYVLINPPSYRASIISGDRTELSMKVIVGKKANQTNFFHDEVEYVEFTPYWSVPKSIIRYEMIPELLENPTYLRDENFEVYDKKGGRLLDSTAIDWRSRNLSGEYPYVRQLPGANNALGNLKIMFPNAYAIYMHDTPDRHLFSRDDRAFSHGCIRLEYPNAMAAALLGTDLSTIEHHISLSENHQVELSKKVPIYISYFTAWPDDSGVVRYHSDIYDRDTALSRALTLEYEARSRL